MKIEINFSRNKIYQISYTIFAMITTILFPIINYIVFKNSFNNVSFDLRDFESRYDSIIIIIIIIGSIITVNTFSAFKYQKYSIKRGVVLLTHSILDLIFIILLSQMAIINIFTSNGCVICSGYSVFGISLDLSGLFILMIIILSLFILKNIYDLLDFKRNRDYYTTLKRKRQREQKIALQKLMECPNCKYICQPKWKKCPICEIKIKRKI